MGIPKTHLRILITEMRQGGGDGGGGGCGGGGGGGCKVRKLMVEISGYVLDY